MSYNPWAAYGYTGQPQQYAGMHAQAGYGAQGMVQNAAGVAQYGQAMMNPAVQYQNQQPPAADPEEDEGNKREKGERLELWGSKETFNIEKVLHHNIMSTPYFKDLYELKTYHEVIDEIYNTVDIVEPWAMRGAMQTPSSAFCLLVKMLTLKPTVKQVRGLMDHGDSPFIRAVGFLVLRYASQPKGLWDWFEPYFEDDEEFVPFYDGATWKMGDYVRMLLEESHYQGSIMPRIPVPIMRNMREWLDEIDRRDGKKGKLVDTERNKAFASGKDYLRRPPSVKAALQQQLTTGVAAAKRAGPSGKNKDDGDRKDDRKRSPPRDRDKRDRDRRRSPSRSRSRSPRRDDRRRDDRKSDRHYRDDRRRDRDYRDRDRDRGRDRRDRDRERDRDRDYDDRRSRRSPSPRRDRDRDRRRRSPSRSRSRTPPRRSRRSYSRSPRRYSRSSSRSRD